MDHLAETSTDPAQTAMHLHFTQSLEPLYGAGLGSSALGLHEGLLASGHASSLFTTRERNFEQAWAGVQQFVRRGPQKAFYAPEMKSAAIDQISLAEIIHGHGFYVYPNLLFGGLARKHAKPMVYHIQGFLDPWILARSRYKKRIAHLLFENANFRHVAWWRAVSEKEYAQARDYGIVAPIEVLPNGVHMPPARSEEAITSQLERFPRKREKRLVFLSRIHPKKGLDLLFKAWSQIDTKLTQNWEIAVFGPDEGGHLAEVSALLKELNLTTPVHFYGSVSGIDKEAAYRSADLFILPSRSEGFPMAVLEAASYGLPVVQTSECNFAELTHAQGAWEASPEVESIKRTLDETLRADVSELRQRGEAGKRLVKDQYQWSSIAQHVEAACRQHC